MDKETSNTTQAPPAPHSSQDQQPTNTSSDVLGIISIVCAFIGFQLPGFILGLVGVSKAKKEGRSPSLSKIGWILNLVFMILLIPLIALYFVTFNGLQEKAKETRDRVNNEQSSSQSQQENGSPENLDFSKGTTAKFGQLEVSLGNVTRDFIPQSSYERAEEGKELIVVEVNLKNVSDSSASISKYDFNIDVDGVLENSSYTKAPGKELQTGSLAPGASASGQIVFEVPAGKLDLKLAKKDYVYDETTYKSKEVIYRLEL